MHLQIMKKTACKHIMLNITLLFFCTRDSWDPWCKNLTLKLRFLGHFNMKDSWKSKTELSFHKKKGSRLSFLNYIVTVYMYEQGNVALRRRPISASVVSPVGDCGVSVGVRSFYSSLLPHLSLLTAMESSDPCSDTSTSSITHSSDALTAPMRVCANVCDSPCSSMDLCGPSLSCVSESVHVQPPLNMPWMSAH